MFADRFKIIALFSQIQHNLIDGLVHRLLRGDEQTRRIDHNVLLFGDDATRSRFYNFQSFNLIIPKNDTESVLVVGRENIHCVALHAELSALQIKFGA